MTPLRNGTLQRENPSLAVLRGEETRPGSTAWSVLAGRVSFERTELGLGQAGDAGLLRQRSGPVQTRPVACGEDGALRPRRGRMGRAPRPAPLTRSAGVPLADALALVVHVVPAALPGGVGGPFSARADTRPAPRPPWPQTEGRPARGPLPAHPARMRLTEAPSRCPRLCRRARCERRTGVRAAAGPLGCCPRCPAPTPLSS